MFGYDRARNGRDGGRQGSGAGTTPAVKARFGHGRKAAGLFGALQVPAGGESEMAKIDRDLLNRLHALGPDGACEVVIVPRKRDRDAEMHSAKGKSAVDRILEYLSQSSRKFSHLQRLGVITASLRARDVVKLARDNTIEVIAGNFGFDRFE